MFTEKIKITDNNAKLKFKHFLNIVKKQLEIMKYDKPEELKERINWVLEQAKRITF